jgi:hypothetical protein
MLRQRSNAAHALDNWVTCSHTSFHIRSALKRECTSHLVHRIDIGTSGGKSPNRIRVALIRGPVERGTSVLRKKEKKREVRRGETVERVSVRVRRRALTQRRVTEGATSTDSSGLYPTACQERFPLTLTGETQRGDRPKRQAPDCGDHCQIHEQHAA